MFVSLFLSTSLSRCGSESKDESAARQTLQVGAGTGGEGTMKEKERERERERERGDDRSIQ